MISAGPAGDCRGPPGKSAMCLPSPGAALARGVRCTLRHGVCACDGRHMAFDLILDHGTVLDGTGRDGFPASVAIADGRIAAVGVLDDASAARRLDCTGQVIAPGFIDMHSHSDWVIPQPDHAEVLAPLLEQGITTIVAGNCGCSPAPYLPGNQALLPLVGRMLHDHDLDYGWSGMGSFLAALERRGLTLNVAQLVGHGTVRAAVKGAEPGPATPGEVAAMADLVRGALDEGAIGLSTGLGYAPGVFAGLDELLGVTARLQERGGTLDGVLPSLGMRWEYTQILWVPKRELAHYEGQTIADIARERRQEPTETYLDLVGELGSQARIMNWNYSGRDAEEGSLRKVLQHGACCFETDTILTGNGVDNPASYGTFPRLLGRYVRELKLLTLPEAVRRMTGFNAERMNLRDRGRVERGLAADLVVFDPDTVNDDWQPGAPNRSPTGIDTVVLNGRLVVEGGHFDRASRAGAVLRS